MKTTFNRIRSNFPRDSSVEPLTKLSKDLGKTNADDAISVLAILDSIGLDWALWNLRTVDGHDREIRQFSVWCAREVQHLMTDKRSINALAVAEKYARGEAALEDLVVAHTAAQMAALSAQREYELASARLNAMHQAAKAGAAKSDPSVARWDPVPEATRCSALCAASYAAKAAQSVTMHDGICGSHVSDAGVAAYDAAKAASKVAFHIGANATRSLTDRAGVALNNSQAFEDAARAAQENELRRICAELEDKAVDQ